MNPSIRIYEYSFEFVTEKMKFFYYFFLHIVGKDTKKTRAEQNNSFIFSAVSVLFLVKPVVFHHFIRLYVTGWLYNYEYSLQFEKKGVSLQTKYG